MALLLLQPGIARSRCVCVLVAHCGSPEDTPVFRRRPCLGTEPDTPGFAPGSAPSSIRALRALIYPARYVPSTVLVGDQLWGPGRVGHHPQAWPQVQQAVTPAPQSWRGQCEGRSPRQAPTTLPSRSPRQAGKTHRSYFHCVLCEDDQRA